MSSYVWRAVCVKNTSMRRFRVLLAVENFTRSQPLKRQDSGNLLNPSPFRRYERGGDLLDPNPSNAKSEDSGNLLNPNPFRRYERWGFTKSHPL